MDYRTSLQHLIRNLLPSRHHSEAPADPPAFAETCRDVDIDTEPDPLTIEPIRAAAAKSAPAPRRSTPGWAESSIELAQGTEIMEFPEDSAADLMDEYFAELSKRAA